MKTDLGLTQETFDDLLAWLDSNREVAGGMYEEIRTSLVKIFAWRKCGDAEGLADETINIVAHKVAHLKDTYEGKPKLYFFGVARKLIKECNRSSTLTIALDEAKSYDGWVADESKEDLEEEDVCLRQCLEQLGPSDRKLVIEYHAKEGQPKIDLRKEMAQHLGIDLNALRVRMYRIRNTLGKCIDRCIKLQQEK
jgi:DNA-directed RNA polymerase specialized sigma24 family protein